MVYQVFDFLNISAIFTETYLQRRVIPFNFYFRRGVEMLLISISCCPYTRARDVYQLKTCFENVLRGLLSILTLSYALLYYEVNGYF